MEQTQIPFVRSKSKSRSVFSEENLLTFDSDTSTSDSSFSTNPEENNYIDPKKFSLPSLHLLSRISKLRSISKNSKEAFKKVTSSSLKREDFLSTSNPETVLQQFQKGESVESILQKMQQLQISSKDITSLQHIKSKAKSRKNELKRNININSKRIATSSRRNRSYSGNKNQSSYNPSALFKNLFLLSKTTAN